MEYFLAGERTIELYNLALPDNNDPSLLHYLKQISENENRLLRVVVNISVDPMRKITV